MARIIWKKLLDAEKTHLSLQAI